MARDKSEEKKDEKDRTYIPPVSTPGPNSGCAQCGTLGTAPQGVGCTDPNRHGMT